MDTWQELLLPLFPLVLDVRDLFVRILRNTSSCIFNLLLCSTFHKSYPRMSIFYSPFSYVLLKRKGEVIEPLKKTEMTV